MLYPRSDSLSEAARKNKKNFKFQKVDVRIASDQLHTTSVKLQLSNSQAPIVDT